MFLSPLVNILDCATLSDVEESSIWNTSRLTILVSVARASSPVMRQTLITLSRMLELDS